MPERTLPTNTRAQTQADRLLRHCVYLIATGKWSPGDRLPSIRETRRDWGLNQLTVQQAYRRLAAVGLVESRPRSGYYVAGGGALERLSRHRYELANLHRSVAEVIRGHCDLSLLGVLRYLAQLEEIERTREPEVAFVECTATQAAAHAAEIARRLGIPVLPLTTAQIAGRRERLPSAVRRLLTSAFHLDELRPLQRVPALTVSVVPIEVSPQAVAGVGSREILLLEQEESMAAHIAEDTARLLGADRVRTRLTDDPAAELARLLGAAQRSGGPIALLSPRLWGRLDERWRGDERVREASFRIAEDGWAAIAEAVGLPLSLP
ncbi:MAG TPA: GntR family transcriptional regulator [Thermoanaerobaculia bacterium]|nr:GntR family transcriptional regulator [Thermoanaerobaculia bacterium]